eukprot:CAMPEP_0170505426 /NCGR_PEP_ID=MMETSP0208-20121228/50897_1 /TAXON_ID=197538 /ORGANISM="Strombidium inclinatum, Strain S3" /LENGTH=97 /DNA_ID=CAMNT_0010786279 /DNA_START=48 /DNA_END=341 /DNA_ORIENTATION=-
MAKADDYFNILSFDGAGIENLVTLEVISKMEKYAYSLLESKKNLMSKDGSDVTHNFGVPHYKGEEGKVAMKDLFNMTAGVSISSFLAVGFAIPQAEN